jgi:hypothetical protein
MIYSVNRTLPEPATFSTIQSKKMLDQNEQYVGEQTWLRLSLVLPVHFPQLQVGSQGRHI